MFCSKCGKEIKISNKPISILFILIFIAFILQMFFYFLMLLNHNYIIYRYFQETSLIFCLHNGFNTALFLVILLKYNQDYSRDSKFCQFCGNKINKNSKFIILLICTMILSLILSLVIDMGLHNIRKPQTEKEFLMERGIY